MSSADATRERTRRVSQSYVQHEEDDFLQRASLALCPRRLLPLMRELLELYPALNELAFAGALKPSRAIVFELTPFGKAAGLYRPADEVIVIAIQKGGTSSRRGAADILLHEMAHAYVREVLDSGLRGKGDSCHNNTAWCETITAASAALGWEMPRIALPVKVRRLSKDEGGGLTRKARPGHLERKQLGRWPHFLRPDGYYEVDDAPVFPGLHSQPGGRP